MRLWRIGDNMKDIEKLAVEAGILYVDDSSTIWQTKNNAIEVLDKFAQLVIEQYTKEVQQ